MHTIFPCLTVMAAQAADEGTILSFDKNLIVSLGIMWFNVIVLTAALVFLLYKPVKKFMADRGKRIQNEIETARRQRDEAQDLKEQYERMIASIEDEREEILRQAYKKAMEKSDQMLFNARREADAFYSRALADLEVERQNIQDEMKRQMIDISVLMAGRFVEVSMDRVAQDRYIEEALAEWEEG